MIRTNRDRLARLLVPGDAIDLYRTTARLTMRAHDVARTRHEHAIVTGVTVDDDTVRLDFANYRPAYLRAEDTVHVDHRRALKEKTA